MQSTLLFSNDRDKARRRTTRFFAFPGHEKRKGVLDQHV